jgi:cytochrome c oxidase assembly protein subunit 15
MTAATDAAVTRLRRWTDAATVGLFIVILIGFLDTFTGSAEGCGVQWPLCNGGVVPGPGLRSEVEYWHRAITGLAGILVVVVAVWAWRRFRHPVEVRVFAAIAVVFVAVQAVLGALAVFFPESAPLLATHFGFALLAFAGIGLLDATLRQLEHPDSGWELRRRGFSGSFGWLSWVVLGYTMALAYWGTYVAHAGAGIACQGWPLCNGQVWPGFVGPTGLIFAHRLGALLEGALVAWLFVAARRDRGTRPDAARAAHVALALTVAQIASGAYLILSELSVNAELLHVSLVTALFLALSYGAVQALPGRPRPES